MVKHFSCESDLIFWDAVFVSDLGSIFALTSANIIQAMSCRHRKFPLLKGAMCILGKYSFCLYVADPATFLASTSVLATLFSSESSLFIQYQNCFSQTTRCPFECTVIQSDSASLGRSSLPVHPHRVPPPPIQSGEKTSDRVLLDTPNLAFSTGFTHNKRHERTLYGRLKYTISQTALRIALPRYLAHQPGVKVHFVYRTGFFICHVRPMRFCDHVGRLWLSSHRWEWLRGRGTEKEIF